MSGNLDSGFRLGTHRYAKSKYSLPADKILDEKTYRLRLIMRAAASLITCPAYLARILTPAAISINLLDSLVGRTGNSFLVFAPFAALAAYVFFKNKWRADDIVKRQRLFFFHKPDLGYSDDSYLAAARKHERAHDLLFNGLRACFAASHENIWFRSLALEATHASPVLKSWKAICAGLQLGLRHNVLRSFISLPSSGEQIVFRLDNACYRSPIQSQDRYGRMGVTESNLQDAYAWTSPMHHLPTFSHFHRLRRHIPAVEAVTMLSRAAHSAFSRFSFPRVASFRRRSVLAARRPAR